MQEHKNALAPHNSDPAVAASKLKRGEIHLLDVSGTQLDASGLLTLAKGLPTNTTLTKLYMAGAIRAAARLSAVPTPSFTPALHGTRPTHRAVDCHPPPSHASCWNRLLRFLLTPPRLGTDCALCVLDSHYTPAGLSELCHALVTLDTLEVLDLSGTPPSILP